MITPADLAHMMANASGEHTQNGPTPGQPLYTSESNRIRRNARGDCRQLTEADLLDGYAQCVDSDDGIAARAVITEVSRDAHEQTSHPLETHENGQPSKHSAYSDGAPTPKIMPHHRNTESPSKFATLDAQELPVEREYSAGGLIFDEHGRVALIARHSRNGHLEWCLPKGHIEKGETPEQTAVREVHEETGILGEIVDSIATIDYWFTGTSQRVHKLVHHFALRRIGGELTVEGDPDHEAEDAIWVNFDDLESVLSYPNERKIAWLWARKQNKRGNE
ncbi:ADP-ribose pyrophosphatase YjhB, NUDIX family [Bifidobacterium bohemicum]|uniref:Phosphohydrolase (MutT/nudix family protein) n=1 Tax=Bifidobacterium bohemicum DSM 22767 TaxID=1437606 RepID=A0A086ZH60_9BIFI|nr:NUDIX hydrolase [Bifidobacterium bohemicum]KFI45860.1 Phosphohydrolase (MutT/nudix family protein) [Bifidobacterium bohemicum DSM 22767]SCC15749.1 ADP-ribose pyrophosphatase YjhB, NUDIX family [Bifidobacterium bohemicum]